jgi:uncharacterized membrane protein
MLLVLAAPFLFLAVVWPRIPERVPIHFNASFTPDLWSTRLVGMLFLPCINVLAVAFVLLWFRFDSKMAKSEPETRQHVARVLRQFLLGVATLVSAASAALVWASWGQLEPVALVISIGVPLLLTVLGNGMGKLRPNHTVGVRLPWTLKSVTVWNRTHRFGGKLLVGIGVSLLCMDVFGFRQLVYPWATLIGLAIWATTVLVYAYMQSRLETKDTGAVLG